jgi:tRNA pseudouridine38-40 synthase
MPRYFIHMAYDGTGYYGWQVQPDQPTVQQVMEEALSTLLRKKVSLTGAGRTDTGVHASCFVAHFDTHCPISVTEAKCNNPQIEIRSLEDWVFKLNRFLPADIVVFEIAEVPDDLHARYAAISRTYQYHISRVKPLFDRSYAHYVFGNLDSKAIQQCCKIILETSDFTSFSKLHTDVKSNICKVSRADWIPLEKGYRFEIKADRFLRNMVRSIVGTLLEVGKGKIKTEEFQAIVDARDRGRAGQSAPAQGLFLVDIGYDPPVFK